MTRASVCADAIRQAGALATIPGHENQPFYVSLQPSAASGDTGVYPDGTGYSRRFDLFVPRGAAADILREGDSITWMGARYRVLRLERQILDGEEVLRQGVAVMEQEAE